MLVATLRNTIVAPLEGLGMFRFLARAQARADHIHANVGQQAERHPVVDACDPALNCGAGQPADEGHPCLEETKMKSQTQLGARVCDLASRPSTDGHGEGIHDQTRWRSATT